MPPDRPAQSSFPRIIAHRGASQVAPENTLPAFLAARAAGAQAVEFDVSLLGDGTPVVIHDGDLARTSDRQGPLSAIGAADLAGIDAGAWFAPRFAGTRIPTLSQTLDLLEAEGLSGNLELKAQGAPPEPLVEAVAAELARRDWAPARIVVSSFSTHALSGAAAACPRVPRAMLWTAPPEDWADRLAALGASALHVAAPHLDTALRNAAGAEGVALRVYTVNEPDTIATERGPGLDGVITDVPERFLRDQAWARWAKI